MSYVMQHCRRPIRRAALSFASRIVEHNFMPQFQQGIVDQNFLIFLHVCQQRFDLFKQPDRLFSIASSNGAVPCIEHVGDFFRGDFVHMELLSADIQFFYILFISYHTIFFPLYKLIVIVHFTQFFESPAISAPSLGQMTLQEMRNRD